MGSRAMGEWLLRPASLSRFTLTQPSIPTRRTVPAWTSRRPLTNSTTSNAAQPQRKNNNEEQQDESAPAPQPAENPFSNMLSSSPNYTPSRSQQRMSSDIDGIFAGTGDPRYSRTSYAPRPANSSDEANAARMHHKFGEGFSPFRSGGQRKPTLDFAEMLQPDDGLPSDVSLPVTKAPEIPESEKIYPRLNASYGRVVELDETRGRDLVRGISILGSLMGRNKVRQDFMKQKFHERPGLKRKRLLSVRWRARFKKGFTQVTGRVTELTRKGW